jgi:hypothetical protein
VGLRKEKEKWHLGGREVETRVFKVYRQNAAYRRIKTIFEYK